jgi:tetratricopeptide (TPR) repeat protein
MAIIFLKQGMADKAEELYRRQMEMAVRTGSRLLAARAHCGLGDVAAHRGDDPAAVGFYREYLSRAGALGLRLDTAVARDGIGRALGRMGRPEEGLAEASQAVEGARELGMDYYLCEYLLHKAELLRALGRAEEAGRAAAEAGEMAVKCGRGEVAERCRELVKA